MTWIFFRHSRARTPNSATDLCYCSYQNLLNVAVKVLSLRCLNNTADTTSRRRTLIADSRQLSVVPRTRMKHGTVSPINGPDTWNSLTSVPQTRDILKRKYSNCFCLAASADSASVALANLRLYVHITIITVSSFRSPRKPSFSRRDFDFSASNSRRGLHNKSCTRRWMMSAHL